MNLKEQSQNGGLYYCEESGSVHLPRLLPGLAVSFDQVSRFGRKTLREPLGNSQANDTYSTRVRVKNA